MLPFSVQSIASERMKRHILRLILIRAIHRPIETSRFHIYLYDIYIYLIGLQYLHFLYLFAISTFYTPTHLSIFGETVELTS